MPAGLVLASCGLVACADGSRGAGGDAGAAGKGPNSAYVSRGLNVPANAAAQPANPDAAARANSNGAPAGGNVYTSRGSVAANNADAARDAGSGVSPGGRAPQLNTSDSGDAESAFSCPEVPSVYVFEANANGAATERLEEAGFVVSQLPLDQSPWKLRGAIVLGSGVSEHPDYATYMDRYAADLYNFVDKANILVQLQQDASVEAEPPFLPSTHGATRSDHSGHGVRIASPGRALVAGFEVEQGLLAWPGPDFEQPGFSAQDGFEVLLALHSEADAPVLMEGAYGQGRIVLSQLALDTDLQDAAQTELAQRFFANLLRETTRVCKRTTEALAVSAGTISGVLDPNSSVLAVLPDTQVYSLRYPGLFSAQTSFIAQNVEHLNIEYVFHLGDIVNNNTELEWTHAAASMSLLHGRVPYAIVPGNHDYGPSGDASTRDTLFNDYFRSSDQAWHAGFGGVYEEGKLDNSFHLFSIGGHDYIALALEWGPRDAVIDWANSVMDAHPDRLGVLITHAYLNNNDRRYDHTDTEHPQDYNPHEYATPDVNDGEELWQKLVKLHPFVLTLNGHVLGDGAGYLESETDRGTLCRQMLVNYQMRELGGEGYLRLIEFREQEQGLRVWSYSPLYDDFLREDDQEFEITSFP